MVSYLLFAPIDYDDGCNDRDDGYLITKRMVTEGQRARASRPIANQGINHPRSIDFNESTQTVVSPEHVTVTEKCDIKLTAH